jgi:metal-dependent HD superfamily phosphatase/phosphodiesterase
MISYEGIKKDEAIRTYITAADASLLALGYTEHSFAHVNKVAADAANILEKLGYSEQEVELCKIAGYMHDIGNLVNRVDHSQSGALIAFRILDNMGMEPEKIAKIVTAIGNHDEGTGVPVSPIAAAIIIADKSDVRRTRVRNPEPAEFDIHDRVNYSVTNSLLSVGDGAITLSLTVDTDISAVLEYFEIFLERMLLCRRAAAFLGCTFSLFINGQRML